MWDSSRVKNESGAVERMRQPRVRPGMERFQQSLLRGSSNSPVLGHHTWKLAPRALDVPTATPAPHARADGRFPSRCAVRFPVRHRDCLHEGSSIP